MPDTTKLKRMPSNRRALLDDDGKWCVEAASHRQNNNYRHLEAGASQEAAKHHYDPRQREMLLQGDRDDGPFVFGMHSPDQFPLGRSRYEPAAEDSDNLCYDGEETKVRIVKGADRPRKDTKRKKDGRRKEKIKCVLVGDGAVGKTSLITSYAQNQFQYDYQPTAFDNYNVEVLVDQKPVTMEICDTSGQDSLEGLRELCYPGTDVIILCFSVVKPDSFLSIINRWAPGVAAIKAPLILVGTQSDLRDNYCVINDLRLQGENPISEFQAKALATKLNAPYIETSSKTRTRLKDAFDAAIVAGLPVHKKKKSFWKQLFCFS